jgi:hypothetical protein
VTNEKKDELDKKVRRYVIKTDFDLMQKVDRHLSILNGILATKKTKNDWVNEAILEKLQGAASSSVPPKTKILNISIPNELHSHLDLAIDKLKASHGSFSKKQLFLEAIQEKLTREKNIAQEAFSNSSMNDIYK